MSERSRYPAELDSPHSETVHETAVYSGPGGRTPTANDAAEQAAGFTAHTTGQAARRDGEIIVTATDFGLPISLHVDAGQLRREPADLAHDLLRLCRLAAARAGSARRGALEQQGLTGPVLDLLRLPTRDTVEQAEIDDENNHEYEPRSWLDDGGSVWWR